MAAGHTNSVIIPQIEGEFIGLMWPELLEDHLRGKRLEQSLVNAQRKILHNREIQEKREDGS